MGGLVMTEITNCDVKVETGGELIAVCDDVLPLALDVVTICDRIPAHSSVVS